MIFISALSETGDKVRAFNVGGLDCIAKPFKFDEIRVRVETRLRMIRLQKNIETSNNDLQKFAHQKIRGARELQMSALLTGIGRFTQ